MKTRKLLGRTLTVALLAVTLVFARGCREPTQVTMTVRTDAACASVGVVQITVGPEPSATEGRVVSNFITTSTRNCQDGLIGSLVVTPGGAAVAIVVTAQMGDQACTPPGYKECIVARRSLPFVDHVPLRIPIDLSLDCANVPCDAVSSCDKGRCVPAALTCDDTGTCTAGSPDTGMDGGITLDATIQEDATTDAVTDAGSSSGDATIPPIPDTGVDTGVGDAGGDAGVVADGSLNNTCSGASNGIGACAGACGNGRFCCEDVLGGAPMCLVNGEHCPGLALCCTQPSDCGGGRCCLDDPGQPTSRTGCASSNVAPCPKPKAVLCSVNASLCTGACAMTTNWPNVFACD